jgi:hypothetical protein
MNRPLKAQTKMIGIGALFMILLSGVIVIAVFDDVEGPIIYQIDVLPIAPAAGDSVNVIIYAIDTSGVSAAQLSYSVNGEDWQQVEMNFYTCLCISGGRWVATFGPLTEGDTAEFFATVFDDSPTRNDAETEVFSIQIESTV